MLANAPYIEYNANFPIVSNIVNEWRLEEREKTEQLSKHFCQCFKGYCFDELYGSFK